MASTVPAAVNQGRLDLLATLEQRIQECAADAFEAIIRLRLALKEIHDQDLWREAGAANFATYCEERWSISLSSSYRAVKWASAMLDELGTPEAVVSRARETGEVPSLRETSKPKNPRPPRGKAEAIETRADDTQASEAQPTPEDGRGTSPRVGGSTSPRGAQPPPSPHEQLSFFPATKLLEELINNRRDEVLAIDVKKRQAVAVRLRRWADELDPPRAKAPSPPPRPASSVEVPEPNFKKSMK